MGGYGRLYSSLGLANLTTGSVAVRAEFCVIRWFIGLIVPPTNRRFGIPDRIRTGVFSLKG